MNTTESTVQDNNCKVMEQLCDEGINHKPIYTPEYEFLSDEKQKELTYDEEKEFVTEEQDQWVQNMRTRKGMHLSSCIPRSIILFNFSKTNSNVF